MAPTVIGALGHTLRVTINGPLPDEGVTRVYAFLHGRQFALFRHPRPKPVAVLSSLSADGRMQAAILGRLGFVVADGSSSAGGAGGLKGIIDLLKNGHDAAFAVDGPRGPAGQPKPGAVIAARSAAALLVPITASCDRGHEFRSAWDRYLLPAAFSRVLILRAPPLELSGSDDIPQACTRLSAILRDLTAEADRAIGRKTDMVRLREP